MMSVEQDWSPNVFSRNFISQIKYMSGKPTLRFFAGVVLLLLSYLVFDKLLQRIALMPSEYYGSSVLAAGAIKSLGVPVLVALSVLLILLVRYGSAFSPWQELEFGKQWRYLMLFLAVIVAWPILTFGYNYFFQQWYLLDRALIVTLLALSWWRPLFVIPLLFSLFTVYGLLAELSLGGTVLAHKVQVLKAIQVFVAGFCIHALLGYKKTTHMLFMVCCLIGAAYWVPAIAKHQIDWFAVNETANIPLSAYAHGWLGHLAPDTIVAFSKLLAPFDGLLKAAVLVGEGACLFLLLHRRITIGLLVAVIIFHIGVFILFGFLFWTWIALDAAVLLFLVSTDQNLYREVNWSLRAVLSICLILAGTWWAKPPVLAWYDTKIAYAFKVSMIDEHGKEFLLHPAVFSPYDEIFSMASFGYMTPNHPVLIGPYGVTHRRDIMESLENTHSAQQLFDLEQRQPDSHNAQRAARFRNFLYRFGTAHNEVGELGTMLRHLRPPAQYWVFNNGIKSIDNRTINQLVVTEVTSFYDQGQWQVVRSNEVMRVQVAESEQ